MLRELRISQFILVDNQQVPLSEGLNVISGESGAGKSILLDALDFILGERASADLVRSGAPQAEVQALFDLHELPPNIIAALPEIAREEGDGTLILTRTLGANGRGRAFINGRLVTVSTLAQVGSVLVQRSHQRDQMQLLSPAYHREMLDLLAQNEARLAEYRRKYDLYRQELSDFAALEDRLARASIRREELEFTETELSSVKNLRPGMRAELEAQVKRLSSVEVIEKSGEDLLGILSSESGILDQLRTALARTQELARIDSKAEPLLALLSGGKATLQEFESDLRQYLSRLTGDDGSLSKLRDSLAEIARLERKYRTSDEGLIKLLAQTREELRFIAAPEELEQKRKELAAHEKQLLSVAKGIQELRLKAAKPFLRALERELQELGMAEARFELDHREVELSPTGIDEVELLISPNKGSRVQPLKEVASGGELSRVFLVTRKVLGVRGGITVAVFDEVDTGVSGKTARAVGEKLYELSQGSQVLCVTHLPQVASLADHHLKVEKIPGKQTQSRIYALKGEAQVEEIARMLAGYEVTPASRESARELLASKETGKKAA